jgi:phosphatidylglycerol---prolipoprotein diacylglyceryl transferase
MHPILFKIPVPGFLQGMLGDSLPVRLFGLFIITAFFFSTLWVQWRWANMKNPAIAAETSLTQAFGRLIWLLLGNRVLWIVIPIPWPTKVLCVLGTDAVIGFYYYLIWRRVMKEHGREDSDFVFNLAFWLLIIGFLGSRLFWIGTTPSGRATFVESPIRAIFYVWDGGIVWYGGLLFSAAFGIWYLWSKNMKVMDLGDALMVAVAFALFIGRWACLSAGDDFGSPTDAPWGLAFPMMEDTQIPSGLIDVPIHPSQLYMSLNGLTLFLITSWVLSRRKFHGQVVYLSLMLYAIGRSIIELFRGDTGRGLYEVGGGISLSSSQLISIPVFLIALWLYLRGWLRARREEGELPPPEADPAG